MCFSTTNVQVEVFWITTLFSDVVGYQRFGGGGALLPPSSPWRWYHNPEDHDLKVLYVKVKVESKAIPVLGQFQRHEDTWEGVPGGGDEVFTMNIILSVTETSFTFIQDENQDVHSYKTTGINNSMEKSPWEANSHSASQEILCLLWNLQVHFCFNNSPEQVPSLARRIHSKPSHPISLTSLLILPSHLRLGIPSCLFPSGFQPNRYNYSFVQLIFIIVLRKSNSKHDLAIFRQGRPSPCQSLPVTMTSQKTNVSEIMLDWCGTTERSTFPTPGAKVPSSGYASAVYITLPK
jgi:hypothetical protein